MRFSAVALVCAMILVAGCEDDPIIGPGGDDDTGGGSYGVIHFNVRPETIKPPEIPDTRREAQRNGAPTDSVRPATVKAATNDNPKRF